MTARRAVASGLRHPLTWLILFVIIFFYKEIFLGRVFSPSDLLYILPPWQSQEPAGWHFPANATRSDEAFIFFPRRLTLGRDVAQFGFSLWDEHVFAGVPNSFSINFAGAILYPPMWAFVFLDPRTANTVLHLPIPFLAALAMYLLLGSITSSRPIRLLGSLAWAFNGYMVAWLSAFFLPLT